MGEPYSVTMLRSPTPFGELRRVA